LPQIYCKGKFDPPAQVLVIVLEDGAHSQIQPIGEALHRILPEGQYLDVIPWPPGHLAMTTVRQTGCVVNYKSQTELMNI
jgi:hypothetical protein